MCLRGDLAYGVALPVQGSTAVHQDAMDSGAWTTAALLVPMVVPVSSPRLAGMAQELAADASYKEGITVLHLVAAVRMAVTRLQPPAMGHYSLPFFTSAKQ